ncbi:MAG: cyclophilin family peptidyl-prolyl cis-trans isomerase [Glaciecola sp.]|jgi:cyclophilin family peptidyl-prolyl cis-trans isomerase
MNHFFSVIRHVYSFKILILLSILVVSCDSEIEEGVMKSDLNKDIEFVTDYGSIIMRLSDETPKHRNNFIKLVNQKFYDSLLFHRVIEKFIIQTGDPESKKENSEKELGASGLPYKIPAEFRSDLLHKRGALNAAREGDDDNPDQASSSTQFTIVQGRVYNDSTLELALSRINDWLAYNKVINNLDQKKRFDELQNIIKNRDSTRLDIYQEIKNEFDSIAKIEVETMEKYAYPEAHRDIYKTVGGAAHLDQNYTVFGEVIKGMNVVDSIAAVEKNGSVPINDVRIITARLIKRKDY